MIGVGEVREKMNLSYDKDHLNDIYKELLEGVDKFLRDMIDGGHVKVGATFVIGSVDDTYVRKAAGLLTEDLNKAGYLVSEEHIVVYSLHEGNRLIPQKELALRVFF